MTKNNESNNEVKANAVIKKSDDKKMRTVISKRIKTDCKNIVKLSKVNDDAINACHTQASCIDACIRASLSINDTVNKLVDLKLCASVNDAIKRVKRHVKHDTASRVIKRNMLIA